MAMELAYEATCSRRDVSVLELPSKAALQMILEAISTNGLETEAVSTDGLETAVEKWTMACGCLRNLSGGELITNDAECYPELRRLLHEAGAFSVLLGSIATVTRRQLEKEVGAKKQERGLRRLVVAVRNLARGELERADLLHVGLIEPLCDLVSAPRYQSDPARPTTSGTSGTGGSRLVFAAAEALVNLSFDSTPGHRVRLGILAAIGGEAGMVAALRCHCDDSDCQDALVSLCSNLCHTGGADHGEIEERMLLLGLEDALSGVVREVWRRNLAPRLAEGSVESHFTLISTLF